MDLKIRGSHVCFKCDNEFKWSATIKDENIDADANTYDEETGIASFIGKKKIEIDVNCPFCKNVNRFRKNKLI